MVLLQLFPKMAIEKRRVSKKHTPQTVDKPLIRDSKASRKSFILTQIYLQNRDMNNFITRLEKLLRTQEKSCC